MDGNVDVAQRPANDHLLLVQALDQRGPVATAHVDATVDLEPASDVASLDPPLVLLRVDDPDARRRDDEVVVDVGVRARDLAVVEDDRRVAKPRREGRGQDPLAF